MKNMTEGFCKYLDDFSLNCDHEFSLNHNVKDYAGGWLEYFEEKDAFVLEKISSDLHLKHWLRYETPLKEITEYLVENNCHSVARAAATYYETWS